MSHEPTHKINVELLINREGKVEKVSIVTNEPDTAAGLALSVKSSDIERIYSDTRLIRFRITSKILLQHTIAYVLWRKSKTTFIPSVMHIVSEM